MTERMTKPLPFFKLMQEVASLYLHIFKQVFWLIFLAALIQAFVSIFMPQNPTLGLAISLLSLIVATFFYAWILHQADSIYMNRADSIQDSLHIAKRRIMPLLVVLFLYILLFLVLGIFGFGMQKLGTLFEAQKRAEIIFAIISIAVLVYVLTFIAFTMPAVVLDSMSALKSFEYSVKLVRGHWWKTFGILLIAMIFVALISLGILNLPSRNIWVVTLYDFIADLIIYPLMVSVTLVLYHDLRARRQIQGFKHLSDEV